MSANVSCPACGQSCPVPDGAAEVRCANCWTSVPVRSASVGSTASPNRTILAESEPMIRYNCPRCKRSLESPASFAGQKLNCPGCGQRLQIPAAPPPAAPSLNKTILASSDSGPPPTPVVLAPPPTPAPAAVQPAAPAPVARENCLECGVDVTGRSRVQTCPDCGSQLCSAMCYREHRDHAHARKRGKRTRYVECSRCGSTAEPYQTTAISDGGWVTFVILLVVFFPLCWIGLLMTETRYTCADCGTRLS